MLRNDVDRMMWLSNSNDVSTVASSQKVIKFDGFAVISSVMFVAENGDCSSKCHVKWFKAV